MGSALPQPADEPFVDMPTLIASYRPDALRLARRLVRTSTEAEDLAQTALTNTLARAHAISDPSFARAYLLTAVRNLWRNQLRAGRRIEPARDEALIDTVSTGPGPEDVMIANSDAAVARLAYSTLPEPVQHLLWLRYVDRLDYEAIAERCGINATAARQRVHRAREQLRAACFEVDSKATSKRACQTARLRLGRLARGHLAERLAVRVEEHLDICPECRDCYDQLTDIYGTRLPQSRSRDKGNE